MIPMKTAAFSLSIALTVVFSAAGALTLGGCSDHDEEVAPSDEVAGAGGRSEAPGDATAGAGADAGGAGGSGATLPPLYAVATAVTDDSGSTTYVKLFSEFEAELDLTTAREFAGWSDMGGVGRYLFVSSGESPNIQRFTIEDDALVDAGEIGFGNHVEDANFYNQTLVNEHKAYLAGDGEYVVWDPTELAITGTIPFPDLPDRDNLPPTVLLDRGAVVRGDRLYHTVSWGDYDNLHLLPDSRIVVIDTTSDAVVDVIDVPCPAVAAIPKNGGGYYASRFGGVMHVLLPGDSYTTTTIYGIGADGTATREMKTNGWSTRLFKVR